jgi:hypothetical protein
LRASVEGHDVAIKSQRREGDLRINAAEAGGVLAKMAARSSN